MSMGRGRSATRRGCEASERWSSSWSPSSSEELLELLLLLVLLLEVEKSLSSEDEEFPCCSNSDAGVTATGPRLSRRTATAVTAVASSVARVATQKELQLCKSAQSTLQRHGGCM